MDRSGRDWLLFFLTALFRAAGLGVLALELLPHAGVEGLPDDPLLLAALAGGAASAVVARALARRGWVAADGAFMAVALLLPAAFLVLAMQRTGLLLSPFALLLGALVASAALSLAPLPNFLLLAGICLVETLAVVATAQGLLPGAAGSAAPFALLVVQAGLLGLLGYVVNSLAWQLRAQQEELAAAGARDPGTGALHDGPFRARLAGHIEEARDTGEGVALLLFDLPGGEDLLAEAAAVLHEDLRGTDIAGRVAGGRLAAAVRLPSVAAGPRVAARLAARLRAIGVRDPRVGAAFLGANDIAGDPAEAARRLWTEAERVLEAAQAGSTA